MIERNDQTWVSEVLANPIAVSLVSFAMALPIAISVHSKTIAPTFFLAPLIASAMWMSRTDLVTRAFVFAGLCGLVSIGVINLVSPGDLKNNLAQLVMWTMFNPAFVFLGRVLPLKKTVFWLAVGSTIYLIGVTAPLLLSGDPTRAINTLPFRGQGPGTVYLDVDFLGLPSYASFGVNSLVPLFCIQAAIICGAMHAHSGPIRTIFATAIACAAMLIIESDSRAAQGTLIFLSLSVGGYAFADRKHLTATFLIVASLAAGMALSDLRATEHGRLAALVGDIRQGIELQSENGKTPKGVAARQSKATSMPSMETVTTGRTILWSAAIDDFVHSPIFGNGFADFGRFFPTETGQNTTAHCYYLTILWKGGLFFAVPFAIFVGLALRRAWRLRERSSEWYFAATAVVLMFLLPSLTWDILLIPSAGALAWFLLGLLQYPFKIDSET